MPTSGYAGVELRDPRYARTVIQAQLGPQTGPAPTITAIPAASIAGRVVYEDGKPAKDITVMVSGRRGGYLGGALTKADGSYKIGSLPAGSSSVTAEDRTGKWIAPMLSAVRTEEGKTTSAQDIVLTAGAIIEGAVVDEATGKPRSGISVQVSGLQGSWRTDGGAGAVVDKQGRFSVRVMPGRNTIQLFNVDGFGRPEEPVSVTAEKDAPNNVTIKLKEEVVLLGTLQEADGKPRPDHRITVIVEVDEHGRSVGGRTVTDAAGKFTVRNLVAGKARIVAGDDFGVRDWEVVEPKELNLPAPGPVKVVVGRSNKLTLTGRAVTPDGKPVPGALLKLEVCAAEPDRWVKHEDVTTNSAGRFSLPRMKPGMDVKLESVDKSGYRYVSGGKLITAKDAMRLSDIILAPLTGKLTGKVFTSLGVPVAGAWVATLDSWPEGQAKTDDLGRFTLTSIPEGDVTVIAACGFDKGTARARSGGDPVVMKLFPADRPTGGDIEVGYAILKEAWDQPKGGKYRLRDYLPLELAPYDPDLALDLARGQDGTVPDSVISGTITTLAQIDPGRAAEWSKDKLDQIKDRHLQASAALSLGLAAADTKPELASDLYGRAKKLAEAAAADDAKAVTEYGLLAALAARLANGEAEAMVDKALDVKLSWDPVKGKTVREVPDQQAVLAALVGRGSTALAEKIMSELPAMSQAQALGGLVRAVAGRDPDDAREILARIEHIPDESLAEALYGRAAVPVINAFANDDPEGALAVARKVKDERYSPAALQAAARFQPKDVALTLLREASAAASTDYNDAVENMARAAAAAHELDQTAGIELFNAARRQLESDRERDRHIPDFAYYYTWVDPAKARLMLESACSRLSRDAEDSWRIERVATAMARIDIDRALEIARSIPEDSDDRCDALRKIAQCLLAPESDRDKPESHYWTGVRGWWPDMPVSLALSVWRD